MIAFISSFLASFTSQGRLDNLYKVVDRRLGEVRFADAGRIHQQKKQDELGAELVTYGTPPNDRYRRTLNQKLAGYLPLSVPFIDALVIRKMTANVAPEDLPGVFYYLIALFFSFIMLKFEIRAILSHLQRALQTGNAMQAGDTITIRTVWNHFTLWVTMVALPAVGIASAIFAVVLDLQENESSVAFGTFTTHLILSGILFVLHFLVVVYHDETLRAEVIVKAFKLHDKQQKLVEKAAEKFTNALHQRLIPAVNEYLNLFQRYNRDGLTVQLHPFPNDLIGYVNAVNEYQVVERNERQLQGIPAEDMGYKDIIRRYATYEEERTRLHLRTQGNGAQQQQFVRQDNSNHVNGTQAQANHEPIVTMNGQAQPNEQAQENPNGQDTYHPGGFFEGEREV